MVFHFSESEMLEQRWHVHAEAAPQALFGPYQPPSDCHLCVPSSPQRGSETVLVVFEGSVAHHDAEAFVRSGGPMHMMQVWVHLPAVDKTSAPGYRLLEKDRIGVAALYHGAGIVRVIAGEYAGLAGAARTHTPIDE